MDEEENPLYSDGTEDEEQEETEGDEEFDSNYNPESDEEDTTDTDPAPEAEESPVETRKPAPPPTFNIPQDIFTAEELAWLDDVSISNPMQAQMFMSARFSERNSQASAAANYEYYRRSQEDPIFYQHFGARIKTYLDATPSEHKSNPIAVKTAELRALFDELEAEGGSYKKLVNRLHAAYNGPTRRPEPKTGNYPTEKVPAPTIASGGGGKRPMAKATVNARTQQQFGLSDAQLRNLETDERF